MGAPIVAEAITASAALDRCGLRLRHTRWVFVLVLTGPPGVGKTSVLTALVDALSDDDVAHAAIEVEALRWAHPALGREREMLHLEALSTMYREAGYDLLLLARTVETDQELLRLLEAASADERFVVRLEARPATLVDRIVAREPEAWTGLPELVEHAQRLAVSMRDLNGIDLVLTTEGRRAESVAASIRETLPGRW